MSYWEAFYASHENIQPLVLHFTRNLLIISLFYHFFHAQSLGPCSYIFVVHSSFVHQSCRAVHSFPFNVLLLMENMA